MEARAGTDELTQRLRDAGPGETIALTPGIHPGAVGVIDQPGLRLLCPDGVATIEAA